MNIYADAEAALNRKAQGDDQTNSSDRRSGFRRVQSDEQFVVGWFRRYRLRRSAAAR